MGTSRSRTRSIAAGVALALAAVVAPARNARAQCSASTTSCMRCHEAEGARPVLADGSAWHRDHAFGDVCVGCHGGDPRASTVEGAHASMASALSDPRATCGACHEDATARADRYVALAAASPPPRPPPSAPPPRGGGHRADPWLAFAIAVFGVLGAAIVVHRERGRDPIDLRSLARRAKSSPALAGAGLGLVAGTSIAFFGHALSASAAFDRLAAFAGRAVAPSSSYWRFTMPPAIDWSVWLMIGVLLGAFFSSALAGTFGVRAIPEEGWIPAFGPSRARRAVVAFVGAALVQFAAGIAGGCTSGLAISGGVVLAPAAFLFMIGMFAGGIPTARLVHRKGRS